MIKFAVALHTLIRITTHAQSETMPYCSLRLQCDHCDWRDSMRFVADGPSSVTVLSGQQFPEARKSQHSSGLPTCLFVNRHAKMGLS
jgi:hypothetical protein